MSLGFAAHDSSFSDRYKAPKVEVNVPVIRSESKSPSGKASPSRLGIPCDSTATAMALLSVAKQSSLSAIKVRELLSKCANSDA